MERETLSPGKVPRTRVYDVLVPVTPRSEPLAEATVASLLKNLARPEALWIVTAPGPGANGPDGLETGPRPADIQAVWKMALGHLAARPERDLLVVSPGVLAAPLLDLRLQWSAYAADRVASVSPLCDLDPITSRKGARLGRIGRRTKRRCEGAKTRLQETPGDHGLAGGHRRSAAGHCGVLGAALPGQGMEEAAGQVSHEVWLPWKLALASSLRGTAKGPKDRPQTGAGT